MPKRDASVDSTVASILELLPADSNKRVKVLEGLIKAKEDMSETMIEALKLERVPNSAVPILRLQPSASKPSTSKRSQATAAATGAGAAGGSPTPAKGRSVKDFLSSMLRGQKAKSSGDSETAAAAAAAEEEEEEAAEVHEEEEEEDPAEAAEAGDYLAVECDDPDYDYYILLVERPLHRLPKAAVDAYGNKFGAGAQVIKGRWLQYAGADRGRRYTVCEGAAYALPGQVLAGKLPLERSGATGILTMPANAHEGVADVLRQLREARRRLMKSTTTPKRKKAAAAKPKKAKTTPGKAKKAKATAKKAAAAAAAGGSGKKRGRPAKKAPTPGGVKGGVAKKRGPGRPPKTPMSPAAAATAATPKSPASAMKRGPGRPPKTPTTAGTKARSIAISPVPPTSQQKKRGPGRPPKSPAAASGQKRGPGRPPKSASK